MEMKGAKLKPMAIFMVVMVKKGETSSSSLLSMDLLPLCPPKLRGAVGPAVHAEMMGGPHGHEDGVLLIPPFPGLGAVPLQDFGV